MSFPARLLVVAAGALGGVPACATVSPAEARGPNPAAAVAVTGMIMNAVTGRPLGGAIVELDGQPRAESGGDGRFHIAAVKVGRHVLQTRRSGFRRRVQPVEVGVPGSESADLGSHNDFIVLLFAPSAYFDSFPAMGTTPPCRTDADCPEGRLCLMTSFKEADAPACTTPVPCLTERDCKIGQQCEPIPHVSGASARICQGHPAPVVDP